MTDAIDSIEIPSTIPVTLMRGGTSRALFFNSADLQPFDPVLRDALIVDALGLTEKNRVDGLGGGNSLTNKVAEIGPSQHPNADVSYRFGQGMDDGTIARTQSCGNILIAAATYAIEAGYVRARQEVTTIRVHHVNNKAISTLTVQTPGGVVTYDGDFKLEGVSTPSAPVSVDFDIPSAEKLMPTGRAVDVVAGMRVTLVNWGMPVVVARATDLGIQGYEDPADLMKNTDFMGRINHLRIAAGEIMGLGDVTKDSVPKVALLAPAHNDGNLVATTCMIAPTKLHTNLGVMAAASIAWAVLQPDAPTRDLAVIPPGASKMMRFEHSEGVRELSVTVAGTEAQPVLMAGGEINTARRLTNQFLSHVNKARVRQYLRLHA